MLNQNLCNFKKPNFKPSGFTLIEALIVASLLSILAGVVIAVINPNRQRLKADMGVFKENVSKLCFALQSCVSSTPNPMENCTTLPKINVEADDQGTAAISGVPKGSVYDITDNSYNGGSPNAIVIVGRFTPDYSNPDHKTCHAICGYDIGYRKAVKLQEAPGVDESDCAYFGF